MRLLRTALLLALLPSFLEASTSAVRDIRPDPANARGVWEGWGVSLCWWAHVFGDRDDIADAVFTTRDAQVGAWRLPGLGLNIVRYNAGGSAWREFDGRRMVVSKTILPYRQMPGTWLDPRNADPDSSSWDWNADARQRAMLLKARDRGADRFELFSNAPMWWMCANDNPSGAASKTQDNLLPAHYHDFAVYLATIARRAKDKWGIDFTSVEPFNEPVSGWWFADCKQEGLYLSPASQAAFLPQLRTELDQRGLRDLPIAASDETNFTEALTTWNHFDAATKALVGKVNVHGYEGAKGPRASLHDAVARDGKPFWLSEYGDRRADGLDLARCLDLDFAHLHPTAWVYWQVTDGGGWGLLDADMAAAQIRGPNPKWYLLAQYTRHIRPGMTILATGDGDAIAAYSATEKRLALVIFNPGPARTARVKLDAFHVADGKVDAFLTAPKATARYEPQPGLRVVDSQLVVPLPADSVQSIDFQGIDLKRN